MSANTIARLRSRVQGSIITPTDDEARAVHNAMIERRPAVVVRTQNPADVAATVDYARENEAPPARP